MALKLMYITNRPDVAIIAENVGIDRIFIDMEYIGKSKRQKGMDTVQNHHTVEDVKNIRSVLTRAQLLVRINPIHEASDEYCSTEDEIDAVIDAGADVVMLPYFKTLEEVKRFVSCVNCRAKTLLLIETPQAVDLIDDIIAVPGIDEVYIGINDLSLGYGKTFMFELLADGTVEKLCAKFKHVGIPYGFGGIASIGTGELPAEIILKEHYRLGSSMVILSRSFCNINSNTDLNYVQKQFGIGVQNMRTFENRIAIHSQDLKENKEIVAKYVAEIIEKIESTKLNSLK